jgi:hypothetical protein
MYHIFGSANAPMIRNCLKLLKKNPTAMLLLNMHDKSHDQLKVLAMLDVHNIITGLANPHQVPASPRSFKHYIVNLQKFIRVHLILLD